MPSSVGTEINLTGIWTGSWSSANGIDGGSVSTSLTQSGSSLSGTVSISGSPCLSSGEVSGAINDNNVSFGAVSGTDKIFFTATCTSNSMSGEYSITSGFCAGDTGTFQ